MKKKLMSAFLSERKQCVVHGSKQWMKIDRNKGSPQATVLVPLLFLLSFNDQPQSVADRS